MQVDLHQLFQVPFRFSQSHQLTYAACPLISERFLTLQQRKTNLLHVNNKIPYASNFSHCHFSTPSPCSLTVKY